MAISCTPEDLIAGANEFCCITGPLTEQVKLYLLRHIAGLEDVTPQELLQLSKCFQACIPDGAYKGIEAYLACQIASGGAGSPFFSGTPSDLNLEEAGVYAWYNGDVDAGLTGMVFNGASGTIDISIASILSFSAPNYTGGTLAATYTSIGGCTLLQTLNLPLLQQTGDIYLAANPALLAINLPSLVTCGKFEAFNNTAMTSISVPLWVPTNAKNVRVENGALDQTSVDHVLARLVASAGYVSGTVSLNGGTNATPGAQGLLDKATLIGRGCTVNTN